MLFRFKKLSDVVKKYRILNIFIYLNFSCNLRCKYCNSWFINKKLKGKVITFEIFKKRIDEVIRNKVFVPVTFYGGEPLIYKDLLIDCISYLELKGFSPSMISVFTNGTLIDEKFASFVRNKHINLIISLDGKKEFNDRNRIFFKNDVSVYDTVLNNIKKYDLYKMVSINMVLTPDNVKNFCSNVLHFFSLGFHNINVDLDSQAFWSDKVLKELSNSVKIFSEKYKKLLDRFPYFRLSNIEKMVKIKNDGIKLTLMNDGFFYLCDTIIVSKINKKKLKIYKKLINKLNVDLSPDEFFCGFGLFSLIYNGRNDEIILKKFDKFRKIKRFLERELSKNLTI